MSIYKINSNLPVSKKIEDLNDMILELNGKISQALFNKNEIDTIYSVGHATRQWSRNQSLGHTLATYTGWTHIIAQTGYSVWKYSPTLYEYNSLNQLYCDNKLYENRGYAGAESATAFDLVYTYTGSYVNNTTEAGTESGTPFNLMATTSQYVYCGLSTTFSGVSFEFETRGSGYNLHAEYYNGSTWTELDISGKVYEDDTSNFTSDGRIYFDIPANWSTVAVNSQTKYWVRFSTTVTPVTRAKAYMVYPANSVVSLLQLSSNEVFNEDWAWCSYTTAVYVTIRNAGPTNYEGNTYITSASSSINKQNYFISNHSFTADYEISTFD